MDDCIKLIFDAVFFYDFLHWIMGWISLSVSGEKNYFYS